MTDPLDPSQLTVDREPRQARRAADLAMLATLGAGPRRSRRALFAVAGVAVVAGVAAGGVIVTQTGVASNKNVVQCHTTLEVGRGDNYAGGDMALARSVKEGDPDTGGLILIEDAVGSCSDLWRWGVVRVGSDTSFPPDGQDHPVPDLVACVNRKGVAAVFPAKSPEVCDSLGLKRLVR